MSGSKQIDDFSDAVGSPMSSIKKNIVYHSIVFSTLSLAQVEDSSSLIFLMGQIRVFYYQSISWWGLLYGLYSLLGWCTSRFLFNFILFSSFLHLFLSTFYQLLVKGKLLIITVALSKKLIIAERPGCATLHLTIFHLRDAFFIPSWPQPLPKL